MSSKKQGGKTEKTASVQKIRGLTANLEENSCEIQWENNLTVKLYGGKVTV